MSAPRVFVTGGSGFVGLTILKLLTQRHDDWMIIVADIIPPEKTFAAENGVEYIQTNVSDAEQCLNAVKRARPTLIIHAAGRVPGGLTRYGRSGREDLFAVNVEGTKNMLEAARVCGVANFLYTGSCTSVTDDLDHDYPNFTEAIPFPRKSLIYGESKVSL